MQRLDRPTDDYPVHLRSCIEATRNLVARRRLQRLSREMEQAAEAYDDAGSACALGFLKPIGLTVDNAHDARNLYKLRMVAKSGPGRPL